jgi:tetratricopeptide (TPR) repeat protein
MILVEDLQKASSDVASLQKYLVDNFEKVYDFFIHQKHSDLLASRDKLNRYIQLNRNVILQLEIKNKTNLAFISLLLDISEELGLLAPFRFLYDHLQRKEYNVGERLNAASLYLIGVRTADDYLNRYELIYNHLQRSLETEEDNTDKVLMTMVNYYAQVIHDFGEFNIGKALELKAKIEKSLSDFEFSFMHNKLIEDVLSIDFTSFSDAYLRIHDLLDSFLGRDIVKPVYRKDFLIETGTDYCDLLECVAKSFKAVRQISVSKYQLIKSESIYNSLGRGVAILTDENQLYAYMNSYGNMHYEKLIEAFKTLPVAFFDVETNIVDWGCGQAMASMAYFDYLNQTGTNQEIKNLTLIEPSEIALRRASLHIRYFSQATDIHTINKDLDALVTEDFIEYNTNRHIHLFSNILDIDKFSLTSLLKLIEANFPGDNYYICVSPYINDTRTSRLDAFENYFSKKKDFVKINTVDNRSGQWKGTWTRVVRVFKASI